ncbi:hypothetical protein C8Q79DRAFT_930345 [Trametes meyenii]|nr:hypothetical protein C8Q79DRAFT_930345 [Trametes meyenii]
MATQAAPDVAEIVDIFSEELTGSSLLFLVIRYWSIINFDILASISLAPLPDSSYVFRFANEGSAIPVAQLQLAGDVVQYIPWAVFSALRVLALSGMNWILAAITFLFAMGPAAVNAARIVWPQTQFRFSDLEVGAISALQNEILSIAARTTLMIADVLVIVVTIYSTWKTGSRRIGGVTGRLTLADILLYNGSSKSRLTGDTSTGIKYFVVLLGLNIATVVMAHLTFTDGGESYITPISEPLTAIFICHFLIDLQSANRGSMALDSGSPESTELVDQGGTLRFASRMIGSLGGSARIEWDEVDADPDEEGNSFGTSAGGHADSDDEPSGVGGTLPTGHEVEEKGGDLEKYCTV